MQQLFLRAQPSRRNLGIAAQTNILFYLFEHDLNPSFQDSVRVYESIDRKVCSMCSLVLSPNQVLQLKATRANILLYV